MTQIIWNFTVCPELMLIPLLPMRLLTFAISLSGWIAATIPAAAGVEIRSASGEDLNGVTFQPTGYLAPRIVSLRLLNTGDTIASGLTASIEGAAAEDFSILEMPADEIGPGGFIMVNVRFAPRAAGVLEATLRVSSSTGGVEGDAVQLAGTGRDKLLAGGNGQEKTFVAEYVEQGNLVQTVNAYGKVFIGTDPGATASVPGLDAAYGQFSGIVGGNRYKFHLQLVGTGPPPRRLPMYEITHLAAPVDESFNSGIDSGGGPLAIHPDGRIVAVTGDFAPCRVVRLNRDGSRDSAFGASLDGTAWGIFVQQDGSTVISGSFTRVNGAPFPGLVRLTGDGTVDPTFRPEITGWVRRVVGLPDGRLFIGGRFSTTGSHVMHRLARLHQDGAVDDDFNAALPAGEVDIHALAVQNDGKVLIRHPAGEASSGPALQRLNPDGSPDVSFASASGTADAIIPFSDGRILVAGIFDDLHGGNFRARVARLLPDGTRDPGFSTEAVFGSGVTMMAVQADGGIVVRGNFAGLIETGDPSNPYHVPTESAVARLHPDGEIDGTFNCPSGSSFEPRGLAIDRDGAVYLSSHLGSLNGIYRGDIVRLDTRSGGASLQVEGDHIEWNRGGSVAEIRSAVFEFSTDSGVSWIKLGDGTLRKGGWFLGGVNLPSSGHIRATGIALAANRGAGLIQDVLLLGREATTLEAWRTTHFGSPFNHGMGRDGRDADQDGVPNLLEYAFDLDPGVSGSRGLPAWTRLAGGSGHSLQFQRPPGKEDILYTAEWSTTLAEGDWHPAEDLSTGNQKSFRVPADPEPAKFFRLRVAESR